MKMNRHLDDLGLYLRCTPKLAKYMKLKGIAIMGLGFIAMAVVMVFRKKLEMVVGESTWEWAWVVPLALLFWGRHCLQESRWIRLVGALRALDIDGEARNKFQHLATFGPDTKVP